MPVRLRLPEDCSAKHPSDLGYVSITGHHPYTF
jgi:hypothetical protein